MKKKPLKVTCRVNCTHWKVIEKTIGTKWGANSRWTICTINKKILPAQGVAAVPHWCPLLKMRVRITE